MVMQWKSEEDVKTFSGVLMGWDLSKEAVLERGGDKSLYFYVGWV